MKYLRKFETFITKKFEGSSPQPSPSPGISEPDVDPGVDEPPTKPQRPVKPGQPITRPSVDPSPKAEKGGKVTAEDVANRFIEESSKRGDSVKKYLKK